MSALLRRFKTRDAHRSHKNPLEDTSRLNVSNSSTSANLGKNNRASPQPNASRQQVVINNSDKNNDQRTTAIPEAQYFSTVPIASLDSILHQSRCPYINSACARRTLTRRSQLYEALASEGTFRFILLHSSEDADRPLVCSLFEHAISPGFDYTALSYEWGTPKIHARAGLRSTEFIRPNGRKTTSKSSIIINGQEMAITPNLFDALLHIRMCCGKKSDNVLWVDALCINQRDVIERGRQVAQMGRIYSQAQQVICWLGRATKDTYSVPYYSSLDIVQRSFWDRVWIIQEFILARKVILLCGERSFSPAEIQDSSFRFHTLRTLRSRFHASGSQLTFRDAVGRSGLASATDSRDIIYGIMGLVSKEELQGLDSDYTLSACEVFCRTLQILSLGLGERDQKSLERIKHYSAFRRGIDPYVDERKACNGEDDCTTFAITQTFCTLGKTA